MNAIGRYQLTRQLAELVPSPATQTWIGTDLTLERPVTVRLTEVDSEPGQRLRLQTQSLAAFEHPGLLHILDCYTAQRQLAIVTERLPEQTLADELAGKSAGKVAGKLAGTSNRQNGLHQMAPVEALRAASAVAEALHALHDAGFTHGGVSACQVGRKREGGYIVLTGPPTADAVQIPATRRDDVRSVAALAHELLTGAPPEQRSNGSWKIASSVPSVVKPLLGRACSINNPWPDAVSLVRAFNEAVVELALQEESLHEVGAAAARRSVGKGRGRGRAAGRHTAGSQVHLGDGGAGADRAAARNGRRGWWAIRQPNTSRQNRRRWLFPIAAVGLVGALVVAGVALLAQNVSPASEQSEQAGPEGGTNTGSDNGTGRGTGADLGADTGRVTPTLPQPSTETARVPVEIAQITDFDPNGDDTLEHPERLLNLNDGDGSTGWHTSRYNSSSFGGLKDGVGLLIRLGGDTVPDLAQVVIESPSTGWTFQLLASVERRNSQIEWGDPVAERTISSTQAEPISLDFATLRAATLLLWITDLGDELPASGHRVTITGIRVSRYHTP